MRILKSGQFALIIDSSGQANHGAADNLTDLALANRGEGLCGHFVIDRYAVDDNGYIRLTSTLPMGDLQACVEVFGAELESLLKQASARYAEPPPAVKFPRAISG